MAGLLMTRPLEAARRFVMALPAEVSSGLQVIYAPLITVQPLGAEIDLQRVGAVIFTSSNGVSVAAQSCNGGLPAYCIGKRTTQAAQEAGWLAECCGATADDLVAELRQRRLDKPLLHLRGRHGRGNVMARLIAAGIPCSEQVIYDQPLRSLTPAAITALKAPCDLIVPLFSPRTARQFADLCPNPARIHLVAMSSAVAAPLETLNYKDLQICKEPTAEAMAQRVGQKSRQLIRVESGRSAQ